MINQIFDNLIFEFFANLWIRFVQMLILLFIGVIMKLKNILLKTTKKNIGKSVAATIRGYGEPKLTKKLAKEVQESK